MMSRKYNPESDAKLIQESLKGNRQSLGTLVKKHQDYIYNISLRFFVNPDDAFDATQEILIKIITGLKSFKGKSAFRTWVYRIALNHFLNAPKSKTERLLGNNPKQFSGFSDDDESGSFSEEEVEEVRLLCSTAMFMCLDREQRLIYILGEVFNIDHNLGAELFEVTKSNYRIKLHRAKRDLLNFVSDKCGIIDPKNPCRCPKKTRVLIDRGIVDKSSLKFNTGYSKFIADVIDTKRNKTSDKIQLELRDLFRKSPFQVKQEIDEVLEAFLT